MVQALVKVLLILCASFALGQTVQDGDILVGVYNVGATEDEANLVIGASAIGHKELRRLEPVSELSNVPPPRLRRRFIDEDELDYDDDEDEGPDFWDVVVWFGSQLGRALKLLLVALGKLAYTIYVGIAYGWHEAEHTTAKPI